MVQKQQIPDILARNGFAIIADVLRSEEVHLLASLFASAETRTSPRSRGGIRNLLEAVTQVHRLAFSVRIQALVRPVL
jgi:hypothetical protein